MIITIDDYGIDIDKTNYSFRISKEGQERVISPKKVTAIHILKPCQISTPAILLAAEFFIPLLFFDSRAKVQAKLWNPYFGSTVQIRHKQMDFSKDILSRQTALEWLDMKTDNQCSLLNYLADRVQASRKETLKAIDKMKEYKKTKPQGDVSDNQVFVFESQISKIYWDTLGDCMEKHLPFEKRSRRPAQDGFNALVNYGYGMLYSMVETATITAGLDPHIGLLHREDYDRPAFVFDAIEPFRPWIDRLVVDMALKDEVLAAHFEKTKEGVTLAKEGKKIYIPRVIDYMNERTLFNGRRIKRKDQVQHLLTSFAQYLMNEYEPQQSQKPC